jgi:RNA polymerase sigma factor (sigma-70 family)
MLWWQTVPMTAAMCESSGNIRPRAPQFTTTHWSVVLAAGHGDSTRAHAALDQLCQAYWYPLYAYVRRLGHSPHDAQDLTQEYFARLLAGNWLAGVDRSKGRFRSFLLASLKHFLANEWDKARARKRGGGQTVMSLDAAAAEKRYALEPAAGTSPDKLFDQRWALALLDQVLSRLRQHYATAGKTELFDQLKDCLLGERGSVPYAELGRRLDLSEPAVKVAVHRLRQRYRQLLREEIARTVGNTVDAEDELQHLFAVLRG